MEPNMSKRPLTPDEIKQALARPGMRIHDAQRVFPVGRSKIYALMATGEIRYRKIGKITVLDTQSCLDALGPKAAEVRHG
jgi:hypothetical protein